MCVMRCFDPYLLRFEVLISVPLSVIAAPKGWRWHWELEKCVKRLMSGYRCKWATRPLFRRQGTAWLVNG